MCKSFLFDEAIDKVELKIVTVRLQWLTTFADIFGSLVHWFTGHIGGKTKDKAHCVRRYFWFIGSLVHWFIGQKTKEVHELEGWTVKLFICLRNFKFPLYKRY
jgi:membrane protein YqaA with SNARE-associated domain